MKTHMMFRVLLPLVLSAAMPVACSSDSSTDEDDPHHEGDGGNGGGGMAGGEGGEGGEAMGTGGKQAGGDNGGGSGGSAGASGGMAGGGAGGAAGAAGGAGMGGSGGMAGGGGMPAAKKTAVANIMKIENGAITGTVTFSQEADGVKVVYALENCPEGIHPTHIHAGTGCADRNAQGDHWDGKRGVGIGGKSEIMCGADGKGMLTYTRKTNDAPAAWSIGDGKNTDIVGHPLIVHGVGANSTQRHGCGVITLSPHH